MKLKQKKKSKAYEKKSNFKLEKDDKYLACLAAHASSEKKAEDILLLDVSKLTVVGDYFLIVTAKSTPQIEAIAKNVEETLLKHNYQLVSKEGIGFSNWIVLDFGNIIVHVMGEKERTYYRLEQFWSNGEVVDKKLWEKAS